MTQATTYYDEATGAIYLDDGSYAQAYQPTSDIENPLGAAYLPRSSWISVPFLLPILFCGIAYLAGGYPMMTDVGFSILMFLCAVYIIRELLVFPQRFGIGALLLFSGTLIWFCYDYYDHWMGVRFGGLPVEPWVVAKAAFYHTIFVFFMILGLQIKKGRWLEKLMHAVPEPNGKWLYFVLVLITFFIGMIPFLFFAEESFFVAIYKSFWGGRAAGEGATFTAGRTGNLNFKWSGYVAQLADVGMMGAIMAAFCAIMVRMPIWQKILCWGIWGLWICLSFGTGTRGFVVFLSLPVIMMLFLKFNYQAAMLMRQLSLRAYVWSIAVAMVVLTLVQVQGSFRNTGFDTKQFKDVDVTDLRGNEMFSTTMLGMATFPDEKPFFYEKIPGQGMIMTIPVEMYYLCINWFPRALWNSKPVDPVYIWYNNTTTGKDTGAEGTTISNGAVGHPYIRFGPMGVVQFGLFYGWLMGVVERSLIRGMRRPMAVLFTLAVGTFIFRAFRDLWWHNLYPVIIAACVVGSLVWFFNRFFGARNGAGRDGLNETAQTRSRT